MDNFENNLGTPAEEPVTEPVATEPEVAPAIEPELPLVEDPALAFPIMSIFNMNVDYSVDLSDNVVEALKITNVESVLVMNRASIPQDNPQGTTINLLAPIVFNLDEKLAGQVILSGSGYDISFPLFKNN